MFLENLNLNMRSLCCLFLLLTYPNFSFSQATAFFYDTAGNRIRRNAAPDLTPTLEMDGLLFAEEGLRDFIVNIFEINNTETSGSVIFRISKLSSFQITYPLINGLSGVSGGVQNQNNNWDFTENANFIIATSKPGIKIAQGASATIGFSIKRKSGVAAGTLQNLSVTIIGGSGGDVNLENNQSIVKIGTL
ncbi:hypothetical protein [Dyadobacter luticola]|uniref:Cohesin domain-containing protein n=1 Tax=Dyadobacter luticola TaxID=1979387 RepID=A0A5R9KS03_9BACT|nr:hypothetical protein [Dyadobacter luticola]TLU98947.1 hypothetical protein FEN17_20370 [Dyadobacter luticola]